MYIMLLKPHSHQQETRRKRGLFRFNLFTVFIRSPFFLGKLVRSNSADSVLSTSEAPNPVVMRQNTRASSAGKPKPKYMWTTK